MWTSDKACIDECPVDCIYEGERMLYIHPMSAWIGACERSARSRRSTTRTTCRRSGRSNYNANVDFFDDLGSPGGAAKVGNTGTDHPLIAALPPQNQD